MRLLVLATALSLPLTAIAQQTAPIAPQSGSDWGRVQALPVGAKIYVKTDKQSVKCALSSDDSDSLTCMRGKKDVTFQRSEIRSVKLSRRGRSALIGAAPGTAVTAGSLIALGTENCKGQFLCGLGPAALAAVGVVGAVIGYVIGTSTDFARSTVYRDPARSRP